MSRGFWQSKSGWSVLNAPEKKQQQKKTHNPHSVANFAYMKVGCLKQVYNGMIDFNKNKWIIEMSAL